MRPLPFLAVVLSLSMSVCVPPAGAQVTLNLDAIDQPQGKPQPHGARPTRPTQPRQAAPKPGTSPAQPQKPAGAGNATAVAPAGKPGAAPATGAPASAGVAAGATAAAAAAISLPAAPEPMPVIAPPPAPQAAPPPPPPRPATVPNAGSAVASTQAGARVTFAIGKSDLSPEAGEALRTFAQAAPKDDLVTFNVAAYAAGDKDDPSTSRRLALARALQIRTALMAEGIASTRIYVRAYGATGDFAAGPPDRVDIATLGTATAAAPAPGAAGSATPTSPTPANLIVAPAPAKP